MNKALRRTEEAFWCDGKDRCEKCGLLYECRLEWFYEVYKVGKQASSMNENSFTEYMNIRDEADLALS